jgi:hypothetical protein
MRFKYVGTQSRLIGTDADGTSIDISLRDGHLAANAEGAARYF